MPVGRLQRILKGSLKSHLANFRFLKYDKLCYTSVNEGSHEKKSQEGKNVTLFQKISSQKALIYCSLNCKFTQVHDDLSERKLLLKVLRSKKNPDHIIGPLFFNHVVTPSSGFTIY